MTFEPHVQLHEASVYAVTSEKSLHFVALQDKQGTFRVYSNPDFYGTLSRSGKTEYP